MLVLMQGALPRFARYRCVCLQAKAMARQKNLLLSLGAVHGDYAAQGRRPVAKTRVWVRAFDWSKKVHVLKQVHKMKLQKINELQKIKEKAVPFV